MDKPHDAYGPPDIGTLPRCSVFTVPYLLAISIPTTHCTIGHKYELSQWRQFLSKEVDVYVKHDDYALVGRPLMGCILVASTSPQLLELVANPNYTCYIVKEAIADDYTGDELERCRIDGRGDCEPFLVLEKRMMRALGYGK